MKMKVSSLILFLLFVVGCDMGLEVKEDSTESDYSNSRVSDNRGLSDYYFNYYGIVEKQKNRALDKSSSQNNVYGNSDYHKGSNQQWLIMPVSIGSNLNYIVSRSNSGVLDVHHSNNLYAYDNVTLNNNQEFRLIKGSGNLYHIESPCRNNKVFDLCNSSGNKNPFNKPSRKKNNLYMGNYSGNDNQQFRVEKLYTLSAMNGFKLDETHPESLFKIEQPPVRLSNISVHLDHYLNTTLVGEGLIPYVLIDDPLYSKNQQLRETPYYVLKRKQAWYKRFDYTFNPYSSVVTQEYKIEKGVHNSTSITTQKTISTGWSVTGEAEYTSNNTKNTYGQSFSSNTSTDITLVNTYSKDQIRTYTKKVDFTGTTEEVRLVIYQLVDIYSLDRLDGSHLIDAWTVNYDGYVSQSYFAQDAIDLDTTAKGIKISSK
ncbi:RICIN domain-containing protein [Spirochaeta cellobiosiphila]|uniref:RICIN domain-containing protein n=1 Tax=Spirochaeta cellobiosiphila TaxID=504483 RepID=UPI0003FF613B|nr:hypothetical protein [Spirochaeta cellobiosiphila]